MLLKLNIGLEVEIKPTFYSKEFKRNETTSVVGGVYISIPFLTGLRGLKVFKTTKDNTETIWVAENSHKVKDQWEPDFRLLKGFKELVELVVQKQYADNNNFTDKSEQIEKLINEHSLMSGTQKQETDNESNWSNIGF